MKFTKFYKFKVTGNVPIQKLPAQKTPKFNETSFSQLLDESKTKRLRTFYGTDMPKSFYEKPPVFSLAKERAEKVGRRVTEKGLQRISKIRQAAAARIKARRAEFGKEKTKMFQRTNYSLKPTAFAKRVKSKVATLQTKAIKLADIRGSKAQTKMEQKLGVFVTKPKDRPISFYSKKQDVPAVNRREDEFIKKLKRDMGY
jgi:hypothetical protein